MTFFKKLFRSASAPTNFYNFTVQCARCGEHIEGRVNRSNDLSVEYESGRDVYFVRKTVMGNSKCFQQIEVELKFNVERQLLDRQIRGGIFVEGD